MHGLLVRLVKLPRLRVAYVRAISKTPEDDAMKKIKAWAEPKGFFDNPARHMIFGYNNPSPSPGKDEYGYEIIVTVGPEVKPEGDIQIKEIPGGLYVVTRCKGVESIYETWMALYKYELDKERWASTTMPGLEEHLNSHEARHSEYLLDLYFPIKRKRPLENRNRG